MEKDTGGAAFPKAGLDPWDRAKSVHYGMTLRDYFAAKAISAAWDAYDKGYCGTDDDRINVEIVAEAAYSMADAMLKARNA